MKKTLPILLLLLCIAANAFAAERIKQKVTVFYNVDDAILEAQNSDNDIIRGQQEFEDEIKGNMAKRFEIMAIKRIKPIETSAPLKYNRDELYNIPLSQVPVLLEIKVTGISSHTDTYQNAFGAKSYITVPDVNVHFLELIGERSTSNRWMIQTVNADLVYHPQSYAMGRDLYVANRNDRTLVKNSVRGTIRDRGKFLPPNKYVYRDAYKLYEAGYYADWKKLVTFMKK